VISAAPFLCRIRAIEIANGLNHRSLTIKNNPMAGRKPLRRRNLIRRRSIASFGKI
jgi:hypothetical protein